MDTILLVNDSATLTKVLSAHFQKAGYKVIAVSGVMDAYEAFIRCNIDLILTDYVLRDKDGLEVIQTFRSKKAQSALPIVVFTAMEDDETARRCKEAGANLVLAKNFGMPFINEGARLQFRGEFYNLFNKTNFGAPDVNLASANFGRVGATLDPRFVQLALKLSF